MSFGKRWAQDSRGSTLVNPVAVAAIAMRTLIAVAFLYALARPDLPQFHDAATRARMIVWPFGLILVPTALRLATRGRPYPWLADALLALPLLFDSIGNSFNLYHSWQSYDTMNHGVSWFALALAASFLGPLRRAEPPLRAFAALGAGCLGAILWELGEYAAFIRNVDYTSYAYPDTLTDLSAAVIGSTAAAGVVLLMTRRHALASETIEPAPRDLPQLPTSS